MTDVGILVIIAQMKYGINYAMDAPSSEGASLFKLDSADVKSRDRFGPSKLPLDISKGDVEASENRSIRISV